MCQKHGSPAAVHDSSKNRHADVTVFVNPGKLNPGRVGERREGGREGTGGACLFPPPVVATARPRYGEGRDTLWMKGDSGDSHTNLSIVCPHPLCRRLESTSTPVHHSSC